MQGRHAALERQCTVRSSSKGRLAAPVTPRPASPRWGDGFLVGFRARCPTRERWIAVGLLVGIAGLAACGVGSDANAALRADSAAHLSGAGAVDTSASPQQGDAGSGATPAAGVVLPGVNVLLRGDVSALRGRVGLITNHTGLTADGRSTIDALYGNPDIDLVALFGPEHGLRGTAEAGEHVEGGRDERTGLPIYSLYGETRQPTPEMLDRVDVLVFDIQDIGTRYYTYTWTMALAMQAAASSDKRFVVLDRPDPVGGSLVQGNLVDSTQLTFVGLYPVPMRHGLTVGEIARWVNAEHGVGADLTVVPAQGWERDMWYDDTGLPWVAPSPNMPDLESATHYPGTCLFEGTNLSVGRGTPIAFQQIGAPWLDAETVAQRLNALGMPGVRFDATRFTPQEPGDGKFAGVPIPGIRFVTTDRAAYDPTRAGIAALIEIHALHGDSLTFRESHFDRLAGNAQVRQSILRGASLDEVTAGWREQAERFRQATARYRLY